MWEWFSGLFIFWFVFVSLDQQVEKAQVENAEPDDLIVNIRMS